MKIRLILSALISFVFYFSWAYWANHAEDIDNDVTLKVALIQGIYSGFVALFFTLVLEKMMSLFKDTYLSFVFISAFILKFQAQQNPNKVRVSRLHQSLKQSAVYFNQAKIKGTIFAPVIAVSIQSTLVICVNILNQTPNLALTVAPSIIFSLLYAYFYLYAFLKP